MKVIFTSNRFIDFLIRLLITAIVISPVIIWSWDTVKETTANGMLAAAFVILYSGVLLFILYFCFAALTDLQKPDERKNDERNEDEESSTATVTLLLYFSGVRERCRLAVV